MCVKKQSYKSLKLKVGGGGQERRRGVCSKWVTLKILSRLKNKMEGSERLSHNPRNADTPLGEAGEERRRGKG